MAVKRDAFVRRAYQVGLVLVALTVIVVLAVVSITYFRVLNDSECIVAHAQCATPLAAGHDDPACGHLPTDDVERMRRDSACFMARAEAEQAGPDLNVACKFGVMPQPVRVDSRLRVGAREPPNRRLLTDERFAFAQHSQQSRGTLGRLDPFVDSCPR